MSQPLVSIVMPTFNRLHTLPRAVNSVLNQTYDAFEFIIADDGSTDGTREYIQQLREPRLRYIRLPGNRGEAVARNVGIGSAKGTLIAFHDSDDEWLPDKLESQVNALRDAPPDVGVVYTSMTTVCGTSVRTIPDPRRGRLDGDLRSALLHGNFIGTPTVLVRRECLDTCGGFDEQLKVLLDWELWIRLSEYCKFCHISVPLVRAYYGRPDNIVNNRMLYIDGLAHILDRHGAVFRQNRSALSKHLYSLGLGLCELGKMKAGRRALRGSFEGGEIHWKPALTLALSYLGPRAFRGLWELQRNVRGRRSGKYRADVHV